MRRLLFPLLFMPVPALADVPKVVTDLAPIHSLVALVMGDLGAPDLLVDGTSDPHSFQLRPSQAATVQDADLIVWVGPEFEPWLERVVDGIARPEASLELMEAEGIVEREPMFGVDEHEEHEDEEEGHAHGDHDPHIWLDPQNAKAIVAVVAARLSALDPDHATTYQTNADAALTMLDGLDAELAATLEPVAGDPVVVFHDAYAHFAGRYGLTIAGAVSDGDAADPGAAQLAELRTLVETSAPRCVFAEALHSDKLILTIADGLNLPVGRLDPEGTDLPPGPEVYPAMLRALAAAYVSCAP